MPFISLGLPNSIINLLKSNNISKAFPIQKQAIPAVLSGKDILGIAKTGSGKTLSFVLPILAIFKEKTKLKNRHILALVIVPTRELAVQVHSQFAFYSKGFDYPLKVLAVHGGVSKNTQMLALNQVHVLVATPGRLLDLIDSNAVHLSSVKTLVLDEADKMLNLGFRNQMDQILSLLPNKRQNLLFSATLSPEITKLKNTFLKNPLVINVNENIDSRFSNIELIIQKAYFVTEDRKGPLLRYLIKSNNFKQVLVFVSSVFKADRVAEKLRKNGLKATAIHSKKSQGSRTESLIQFKNGTLNVLVATDLLSRGIDIAFLPCVINYELPRSPKDYIHRIGRTGRAENPGVAYSLITDDSWHHFKVIQKKIKKQVDIEDTESLNLHGY